MAIKKGQSFDLMLGIFVTVGLLVLSIVIFLIGHQRKLFEIRTSIKAHFPNVAGLAIGADVMLGGVVVGHVAKIKFPNQDKSLANSIHDIIIIMKISNSSMSWIKEDSIARIDSKGLLGDKLINISIGSPEITQIKDGGMLESVPPLDFNKALDEARDILVSISDVFKKFNKEGGPSSLVNSVKSIERIIREVEAGNGVLQALIFDKKSADNIKNTLLSFNNIIKEIENGSGFAHDIIYKKEQGEILSNLNKASSDLAKIMDELNKGHGTLGLLFKDPSIYNSIYEFLGNMNRNWILKSVIRYGISKQD